MREEKQRLCPEAAQCPDLQALDRQLREARQEAEQAGKAKTDFLTRMNHEIRTPMNAIIGLAHLCMQKRTDEQQRQYVGKMLASAHNLLEIIDKLLDLSQAESGGLELERLPFQINAVMDNVARIISERAADRGLECVFHTDGNIPPLLMGDPLRLTQVLINLAGNAVKFTEKGTVAVSVKCARHEGGEVLLRFQVADTGIGMTQEQLERVFQPFVQADESMTRRFGGTGIGLAVSRRIVELMGGDITMTRNPGGGSIFSFEARLKAAEGTEPVPSRSLRGVRALIVDDTPLALEIIAANVKALGVTADCASSGAEALQRLEEARLAGLPYQLVILDWRMPDMNGIETARHIRANYVGDALPVILMHSDYDLDEVRSKTQEAGINAFLPKPATSAAFRESIQRALNGENQNGPLRGQYPLLTDNSRVLLVEDNEINQEIACEMLKMGHVETDVANNGEEAVNAVARTAYALVFMDVQMPIMDGLEATRRIRAEGYAMPIIAMTAHAKREDRDMCLAAGMNDYLTKPLAPEALFATLNHWLPFASSSSPSSESPSESRHDGNQPLPQSLKGFNLTAGLAAVGNNERLYADLLGKFAARYATITEDITSSLLNNDLKTAVRLAHTVKGIAANLGAESLAEAAGKLEKTITNDPSMITPHLEVLVLRLAEAITAVSVALGKKEESIAQYPTKDASLALPYENAEHFGTHLESAVRAMETDWNAASEAARHAATILRGTSLEDRALHLVRAVENFETVAALSCCLAMRETLDGAPGGGRIAASREGCIPSRYDAHTAET